VTTRREDAILERVRSIPRGFVATYADLSPGAPRLAGRALAVTDQAVPWHRVVRSDGSVAKGRRQLRLLRAEGVPIRGDRVDLRLARYASPLAGEAGPRSGPGGDGIGVSAPPARALRPAR
jgi:alkylated DNA nucleotide flippase Atl1